MIPQSKSQMRRAALQSRPVRNEIRWVGDLTFMETVVGIPQIQRASQEDSRGELVELEAISYPVSYRQVSIWKFLAYKLRGLWAR